MKLVLTINGCETASTTIMNKKDIPALTFQFKRKYAQQINTCQIWTIHIHTGSRLNHPKRSNFTTHRKYYPKIIQKANYSVN